MTHRLMLRERRRGQWWFTWSVCRPYEWHGPFQTPRLTEARAEEYLKRAAAASFWGRPQSEPREKDLREMAWTFWPELRDDAEWHAP